jgi:hypothetical protein
VFVSKNGLLDKIKLMHAMDFNVRAYLPTVKFSWPERYISLESALYGLLLFQARERSYKNLVTAFLYLRLISVSYDPHSLPRSNKGVLRCKTLGNEVACPAEEFVGLLHLANQPAVHNGATMDAKFPAGHLMEAS